MFGYLFAFFLGVLITSICWIVRGKRAVCKNNEQSPDQDSSQLQELSMLTGSLAHEIKNPLSIIKVNLKLLEENADQQDIERIKRKISVVKNECDRLERIFESFLKYIGKPQPQKIPLDINEIVKDAVDFYSPQAWKNSITVRFSPSKQPLICNIDETMLKQVFLNLFINAQQAMTTGGELMVLAENTKKNAKITFNDTGKGIEPEKIDKIFKAFYTSRTGGSGLGLATAKKIIEAHNGSITVSSEPGKGSSFEILLPLTEKDNEQ